MPIKKRLWHRCFPLNFEKFWRTLFLQTTSGRLLPKTNMFLENPFWLKTTLHLHNWQNMHTAAGIHLSLCFIFVLYISIFHGKSLEPSCLGKDYMSLFFFLNTFLREYVQFSFTCFCYCFYWITALVFWMHFRIYRLRAECLGTLELIFS